MQPDTIQAEHRNGNFFIKIFGEFNQATAKSLDRIIRKGYRGRGHVFVNTERLDRILPDGRDYFRCQAGCCDLPEKTMYLIGKKGFEIVPKGGRVIIPPEKKKGGCCGGCKNGSGCCGSGCCKEGGS
ncbi:MAG: hypothetical protein U9R66_00265 [Thermodesulfobacteriota bacterium]|nr:hypothetical protein [Thermodesulfobacteriota bacterium]